MTIPKQYYAVALVAFLCGVLVSNALQDKPTVFDAEYWGSETNGIKAGMIISHDPSTNQHLVYGNVSVAYTNKSSPRDHLQLWFPPLESCYQLTLFDSNASPVPKTAKGKALGKPLTEPLAVTTGINFDAGYLGRILVSGGEPEQIPHKFVVQDYFDVPKPGRYRLIFEMQVISPRGWSNSLKSTNLPLLRLPPVEANIEIKPQK